MLTGGTYDAIDAVTGSGFTDGVINIDTGEAAGLVTLDARVILAGGAQLAVNGNNLDATLTRIGASWRADAVLRLQLGYGARLQL